MRIPEENEEWIRDPLIERLTNAQAAEEFLRIMILVNADDTLKVWDSKNQTWADAQHRLESRIVSAYREAATMHKVKEIIGIIKISCDKRLDLRRSYMAETPNPDGTTSVTSNVMEYAKALPENKLVLQNAILDVDTLTTEPLGPWYYFDAKLPVIYNPEAKNTEGEKFLDSANPEVKDTLYEIAGNCLYRKRFIQQAVMLYGEGANG
ncbi:hypothetical protein MUP77_24510, partial [Candidatus Bathyarchaeota archaeon]|nr:hypothetical protein [Candidatus Bathyarchaeota archaeon]